MPVAARIDWICKQLEYDRLMHFVSSQANDTENIKFKIVLHPHADAGTTSEFVREQLKTQLLCLRQLVGTYVAIDRGHKHSDGRSKISIVVSWLPPPPALSDMAHITA